MIDVSELRQVAALYVDPRGPYPTLEGVDCWDEARDARLYQGPHAVVAHPPCGPWSATMRYAYGGSEHDCALRALEQVRAFGGVLEHPAWSVLFARCRLPRPGELPDEYGGRTIEVEQVRWGHVARKRTWLYLVGISEVDSDPPPREPTHWCSGRRYGGDARSAADAVPPGIKVASAQQRRRTPEAFAQYLVSLARKSVLPP